MYIYMYLWLRVVRNARENDTSPWMMLAVCLSCPLQRGDLNHGGKLLSGQDAKPHDSTAGSLFQGGHAMSKRGSITQDRDLHTKAQR